MNFRHLWWILSVTAACSPDVAQQSSALLGSSGSGSSRFIVQLKSGGRAALLAAGAQIVLELQPQNAVAVEIPAQALAGLQNHPGIALIEPDPIRVPFADYDHSLRGTPYGISMVQADQLSFGGGRKVCIIDSGYEATHPDLPHGPNVTGDNDSKSGTWDLDRCGHGTHVAGTIAALANSEGVIGVLPTGDPQLHIVKVFGVDKRDSCNWAYSSSLIAAANRCQAAGANVISMSLGGGSPSSTEQAAFDQLFADGILSVAAAGNSGNSSYSYPASYASVVSVAAVDASAKRASFSQTNDQVELAAPGVAVESTIPLSCYYCPNSKFTTPTGYDSWDGTSMATPHVSAVAALIWSADPSKSAAQVRTALQAGAMPLGSAGRNNEYGFGLVQAVAARQCLLDPASCGPAGCADDASCDDGDVCTIDSCDTGTGRCQYTPDSSNSSCGGPTDPPPQTCQLEGSGCDPDAPECCSWLSCQKTGRSFKCR